MSSEMLFDVAASKEIIDQLIIILLIKLMWTKLIIDNINSVERTAAKGRGLKSWSDHERREERRKDRESTVNIYISNPMRK